MRRLIPATGCADRGERVRQNDPQPPDHGPRRLRLAREDTKGMAVYRRAEMIGYVFQRPEYMFTAPNVWEELIYSLHGGCP